jgi:TetR/AcrR family transcriptional regulator, cholesterol catabolism regulator
VPVMDTLHAGGQLAGDPALARLMIFGALNWSVQWYRPPVATARATRSWQRATLDDLTTTALQLFLKAPA